MIFPVGLTTVVEDWQVTSGKMIISRNSAGSLKNGNGRRGGNKW